MAFPQSIKRTCPRFLLRATNHGDRAVRLVEHSLADRTEEQSADPAAATGTDDQHWGVVGCFDQRHGWTLFDHFARRRARPGTPAGSRPASRITRRPPLAAGLDG